MEGAIPKGELIGFALRVIFQQSYPSLFFSIASSQGLSQPFQPSLSVAFPGYQQMSQRMGHLNLGPQPLCFPQPHSRHIMHCHSSICCWPKERPLLELATSAGGAGHSSAQPQEESAFCHHRGNSITNVQTLPFLWETTYWFFILFCLRAPILTCHESHGVARFVPQLEVTSVRLASLVWIMAHVTCDIVVPLSTALPACSQQWQQLPSASQQVTCSKDTQVQRGSLHIGPGTLGKASQSVCCTAVHCRGSATHCGP